MLYINHTYLARTDEQLCTVAQTKLTPFVEELLQRVQVKEQCAEMCFYMFKRRITSGTLTSLKNLSK